MAIWDRVRERRWVADVMAAGGRSGWIPAPGGIPSPMKGRVAKCVVGLWPGRISRGGWPAPLVEDEGIRRREERERE